MIFQAVVSNKAHPEYGQATIPFPIPDSEYDQTIELLEGLSIGSPSDQDCRVDFLDSKYPILNRLVTQSVNVDELDYTQEEFAKMLNIDRSYLSRIESGKKGCSVDLLVQLSELLNVSIDYLVTGEVRNPFLNAAGRDQLKHDIDSLVSCLEVFKSNL